MKLIDLRLLAILACIGCLAACAEDEATIEPQDETQQVEDGMSLKLLPSLILKKQLKKKAVRLRRGVFWM